MHGLRVYLALMSAAMRAQMSYRRSFVIELVGRFAITGLELVAVFVIFGHIPDLAGWTRWEVVYLFGVASLSLGLAEQLTDGLEAMPELVRTGDLDTLLARPAPSLVQVMASRCRLLHLGRLAQGGLALALAWTQLGLDGGAVDLAVLLLSVLAGAAIYAAVFVCGAATCVFTVESAEAFNAFTYGGLQMTQYPVTLYRPWLRDLFLYAVPLGFVTYYPALAVLGRDDPLGRSDAAIAWVPVLALAAWGVAVAWWTFAVRRYQSTGS